MALAGVATSLVGRAQAQAAYSNSTHSTHQNKVGGASIPLSMVRLHSCFTKTGVFAYQTISVPTKVD